MVTYSNKKKYKLCAYFHNVKFGKNVRITGIPRWGSESYLIEIGNNVTITQNVVFHTHDGGVYVLREKHPGINIYGKIKIGSNVFIGSNVIILPGVTIEDNVVIGSGSVVTKNVSKNSIVAGVPAKQISTISDYEKKALEVGVVIPKDISKSDKMKLIISSAK